MPLPPSSRSVLPVSRSVLPRSRSLLPGSRSVLSRSRSLPPVSRSVLPRSRSVLSVSRSVLPGSRSLPPVSRSLLPGSRSVLPVSRSLPPGSRSLPPGSRSLPPVSRSLPPGSRSVLPGPWRLLAGLCWLLSPLQLLLVSAEPELTIAVQHRPFICHRRSKRGDLLLVHQDGYFQNGTKFYTSRSDGDKHAMWFTLGVGQVIRGWDRGLRDMCAGERRKLVIPPELAYGKEGKGKIPPESTLTFLVELLEIRNGPRSHESFQEMDLNDDWRLSRREVKEYLQREFERHGQPPNDTLHDKMVEDIFNDEDQNKDGFLSSREFTYKHDEL